MNPLDLRGPAFLLFYVCLAAVVLVILRALRVSAESAPLPPIDRSDPYLIAYLRGGLPEAARVCVVSLLDRGLLRESGGELRTQGDPGAVRRPIEAAVLEHFRTPGEAASLFTSARLEPALAQYEETLRRCGALPGEDERQARLRRAWVGVGVLAGVANVKLVVAFSRGRHNVWFLVLLGMLACWLAFRVSSPRRTALGDALLAAFRTRYGALKARARSVPLGGATGEVAFLAAAFGLAALPPGLAGRVKPLFPKATGGRGSSSGGSSCGSGCGGSCGGSCGGGGCGGCGS